MPINTNLVNFKTPEVKNTIRKEEVERYLRAINSKNNYYLDNNVAPNIYSVAQEISILESIWKMPDLHGSIEEMEQNVLMLVHGEQTMNFKRLLKFGETVETYAKIQSIIQKGANYILTLLAEHHDEDKNKISDSTWTLFIRAAESDIKKESNKLKNNQKKKNDKPKAEPEILNSTGFDINNDITKAYSEASNDFNPIHLDEDTAKKAGLSGIIVHGLCTMAMTMEQIIDTNLNGNPSVLDSITLRFSSPVYPGDSLQVNTYKSENPNTINFDVSNSSNIKVIKNGIIKTRS